MIFKRGLAAPEHLRSERALREDRPAPPAERPPAGGLQAAPRGDQAHGAAAPLYVQVEL